MSSGDPVPLDDPIPPGDYVLHVPVRLVETAYGGLSLRLAPTSDLAPPVILTVPIDAEGLSLTRR
jgi:hypothetical protein